MILARELLTAERLSVANILWSIDNSTITRRQKAGAAAPLVGLLRKLLCATLSQAIVVMASNDTFGKLGEPTQGESPSRCSPKMRVAALERTTRTPAAPHSTR